MITVGAEIQSSLWLIPNDPGQEVRAIPSDRYDGSNGLAWRDDRSLVFTTRFKETFHTDGWQIPSLDLNGMHRREWNVPGMSVWPSVTPDGKTVVMVSVRGAQNGLWRMGVNADNAKLIAGDNYACYPSITPDGKTVFFTRPHQSISSTWSVPIEGGDPKLVFPKLEKAVVSPEGQLLAGLYRPALTQAPQLAIVRIADAKLHLMGF